MFEKKISIIVPVYNAQDYLERCVESIRTQTFRNLEILLIDDGSKDKSPQMCDDYAVQDERIRVIHKPNGGLMSAWTAGAQAAEGDYFLFVDSDDWIDACMAEGAGAGSGRRAWRGHLLQLRDRTAGRRADLPP